MVLTVMSQNICRAGSLDPRGRPQDRWSGMARIIRAVDPDVLLLQEVGDDEQLQAQRRDLPGMKLRRAPSKRGGTAVGWRPDVLELVNWEDHLASTATYGFATATFTVHGLDVPISFISAHLTPYSAAKAAQEAQVMIARLYRNGGLGLLGGDINHLPASPELDPDPDWSAVPPYNRSARTIAGSNPPVGDRIVAAHLAQGGLVDVAAHLAVLLDDLSLLGPTAVHGGIRVDQFHPTGALAAAARAYRRINPEGYSDHFGIVCEFDLDGIDRSQLAEFI